MILHHILKFIFQKQNKILYILNFLKIYLLNLILLFLLNLISFLYTSKNTSEHVYCIFIIFKYI